jgi:hypothetical protein
MGCTIHSIVRRVFHYLPFLLWSIVTAVAAQRGSESSGLTLAVLGLAAVIFVIVGSLIYVVGKCGVTAENADSFRC